TISTSNRRPETLGNTDQAARFAGGCLGAVHQRIAPPTMPTPPTPNPTVDQSASVLTTCSSSRASALHPVVPFVHSLFARFHFDMAVRPRMLPTAIPAIPTPPATRPIVR